MLSAWIKKLIVRQIIKRLFLKHVKSFCRRSHWWKSCINSHRVYVGRWYWVPTKCSLFSFPHFFTVHLICRYLIRPPITIIHRRGHALTSQQILCVAFRFFTIGSCLYWCVYGSYCNSKASVCEPSEKWLALKWFLYVFCSVPWTQTSERH